MSQKVVQKAKICLETNCEGKYYAKGYCKKHYNKLPFVIQYKKDSYARPGRICKIDGCGGKVMGRDCCRIHYRQLPEVKDRANEIRRNSPRHAQLRRKYNQERKRMIIYHYSKGTMKCECCNETEIEFLTVNHINGGGQKHRNQLKSRGTDLYTFLKGNNFPEGYNILCLNCNFAEGHAGICPHRKKREMNQ